MSPIGLKHKSGKGFQIVHKCLKCGDIVINKIAENTAQADNMEELLKLFQYETVLI